MVNEENPTFESFKDKSNQIQRVMVIFLGVALFFFFMILLPYFSLRVDNYHFSNLQSLSDIIMHNWAYINARIVESSRNPLIQIGDRSLNFSQYSNIINNTKTDKAILQNLTSGSMCGSQPQSQSQDWVRCNLNFFLTLPTKVKIQFNSTDMEKIKNSISLRVAFLDESKSVRINTTNFDLLSNILMNINNSTDTKGMYFGTAYTPTTFPVKNDLIAENKILADHTRAFINRFNATEYPIIGKIPIGFSDMVAVFPIALAISFFYVIALLRDSIRLRKIIEKNSNNDNIKEYLSAAPLWIDPTRVKCRTSQTLNLFVSWIVLALPGIIFMTSIILIVDVWDVMYIKHDDFPPFTAAVDLNKFIYHILYGISSVIFIISYTVLIKEVGTKVQL